MGGGVKFPADSYRETNSPPSTVMIEKYMLPMSGYDDIGQHVRPTDNPVPQE